MNERQTILGPAGARPGMADAVRVGPFIMLAGQVAFDEHGKLVGEGDIRAQAEQCFRNIGALLASAGATMSDLVELTCFLTGNAKPLKALTKTGRCVPTTRRFSRAGGSFRSDGLKCSR